MTTGPLLFEETFDGPSLSEDRWIAHYLPQWTTPDRSEARYGLVAEGLRLLIEHDQPAWRPEDGELRVSNLQTAAFSGPLGSPAGTHRHRDDLRVVAPQVTRRLFLASGGRVEAELRASPDPTVMLAFWLVGLEEDPHDSGEVCVAELFGHSVGRQASKVNVGVKAHHDPRLVDDMRTVELPLDATTWHTYAAVWQVGSEGVDFLVDDQRVHHSDQRIDYPMQLMVDLFEFPAGADRDPARYPKWGDVRAVRAYGH
jgi:hypothetical protein